MSQPTRKSAAQQQPSEQREARKGSATPPRPAPSLYALERQESDGTDIEPPRPQRPRVEGFAARGSAPLYPVAPLPARAGNRRVYWITVREHWSEDFTVTYRLFNHDAPAGDRLWKGTQGPKGKVINWPFDDGAEWKNHDTKEAAESAAAALQKYLNQIEAK